MRYLIYFTFSYSLTNLSGCIFPAEVGWMWSLVRYQSHPTCFLHFWQLSLIPHEPLGNTWKSSLLFSPTCIESPCPSLFQPVPSRAWTPLPVAVLRLWGISAPHFRLHLWTFEEASPAWLYAAKGIKANPPFLSDCFKTHSRFFDMSFMSLTVACSKGEKLGPTLARFEEEVRFNRLTFSNLPWKQCHTASYELYYEATCVKIVRSVTCNIFSCPGCSMPTLGQWVIKTSQELQNSQNQSRLSLSCHGQITVALLNSSL